MGKTKKNAESVNNSNASVGVIENVANEVENTTNVVNTSDSPLPLVDSSVISDQIERGDTEAIKKRDCMELIRNHFRAPVPIAAELFGRFFRAGLPTDNKEVIKLSSSLGDLDINNNMAVVMFVFSLPAPTAAAVSRAANSWWRENGDYVETDLQTVVDFANNDTSLPNDVYFCKIKKEWLLINRALAVFSATNNDGAKDMLLPGCYYKRVEHSTANYIRSVASVGVFLDAKRREMNGKISNIFALRPAVSGYLKKILLAGFLSAGDIAEIASEVAAQIAKEKEDKKAVAAALVSQKEFELTEVKRMISETKEGLNEKGLSRTKFKKLNARLSSLLQKESNISSSLAVARLDLEKLN